MPEVPPNLQSTQVIAKLFGVTTRRVEQLKTEGIIKGQGKPTKYDLLPTIQAYIKYLSDKANGREKHTAVADLEQAKLDAEVKLKNAKASIAELEMLELQGQMHRSQDVEAMTTDLVYAVRSVLIALPGRLAVDVASVETAEEAAVIIRKEVNEALKELSNYKYNPEEYAKKVRERQNWAEKNEETD